MIEWLTTMSGAELVFLPIIGFFVLWAVAFGIVAWEDWHDARR